MTLLEPSHIFKPIIVPAAVAIIVVVVMITMLLRKIYRKNKRISENQSSTSTRDSISSDLRKQLQFLSRVSEKIAEDQEILKKSLIEDQSSYREKIFKDLEPMLESINDASFASLQQKYSKQVQQVEEVSEILQTLENDFMALKTQLQQTSPRLMRLAKSSEVEKCSGTANMPTQTEDCNHELCDEISSSDLLPIILVATKDFLSKTASKSRENGKETIQSVTRYLEQSHKEIRREITIFSTAATMNEKDGNGNNSNLSFINEVDSIEKKLLEMLVYLNKLRFETENMKKTLVYFEKKFLYVITKFDAYWEQSQASYSKAAKRLGETEVLWCSSEEKIGKNSRSLVQQSKTLTEVASEIREVVKQRAKIAALMYSKHQLEIDACNIDAPWIQNVEHASQKLLKVTKDTAKSMNSLVHTTKNLEIVNSLINSVAEGYVTFLNSVLCWQEDLGMSENNPSTGVLDEENGNSCGKISGKDKKFADDDLLQEVCQGVCQELNLDFHDVNMENIVIILKDIVKSTWELVGHRRTLPEEESITNSAETSFYTVMHENNQCEEIPVESLLSEESSDFLIQNSDESDVDSRTSFEMEKS